MIVSQKDSITVAVTGIDSFNIEEILSCGQCFRFEKNDDRKFSLIAFGEKLNIWQTETEILFFPTNLSEFDKLWKHYFDLDRDYSLIKKELAETGFPLDEAVKFGSGIRHLKQESFECMISFIISQNRHIPMIMKSISLLCETFGTKKEDFYAFPTPQQLAEATETDLMACKVGFRAKYIADAVKKVNDGEIDLNPKTQMSTEELREHLKQIKGVGDKIAECVMLFSYGRTEVFPTDVWIARGVSHFYFGGEIQKNDTIRRFAMEKFGKNAGMANQYIYHYSRIGIKDFSL